jgi:pseudaminic acid cytidylyltransferase
MLSFQKHPSNHLSAALEQSVVIIPARGGSKRIPRKNIKLICGQPMLSWPINELSQLFKSQHIVVSTDDDEIKKVVEKCGLKPPFTRPKQLSGDHTGGMAVAHHALEWFEANFFCTKFVLVVYPTAVMLDAEDIKRSYDTILRDEQCDYVMSSTTFGFPTQRAIHLNSSGYAEMVDPNHCFTRSQDLPEMMHDAGQFYLYRSQNVRDKKSLINSKVRLHHINRKKVVDIDTPEDFEVAEALLQHYKQNQITKQL